MKNFRRFVAVFVALVMCVGTASPAFAKDYDAGNGTVHVSGNESWQDENDRYDHEANKDYEVNISGSTDKTVVEVEEDTSDDIKVTIDQVDADVKDGPAADIQGGSVDIKDSNLSTKDEDNAAVEIGGDADVTVSGNTTVNGSGTGIELGDDSSLTVNDGASLTVNGSKTEITESGKVEGGSTGIEMKDDSSLTVEDGGKLEANGSNVNINVTDDTTAKVEVGGGSTGVDMKDNSSLTVKGEAEVTGSVVISGSQNQAAVTVDQDGNTGLSMSDDSRADVDDGELTVVDTETGLNKSYTTQEISRWYSTSSLTKKDAHVKLSDGTYVLLTEMFGNNQVYQYDSKTKTYVPATSLGTNSSIRYFVKGTKADGTPNYVKLNGNLFYPSYKNVQNKLDHAFDGEGTGIALDGKASLEVKDGAILRAYGEENAVELKGDTTVKIGENGLLHILGGPVSIGENSSITSAGIIFADDIKGFTKGGMVGHGAIDFQGTGLHFLSCISGNPYLGESDTIYIYWDIGEDYENMELSVNFVELMEQARDLCGKYFKMTAGQNANYKFVITNNSKHTFAYDKNSLDIGRNPMEAIEELGSKWWPRRTDNFALRALYYPQHDPETDAGMRNLKGWGFGADRVTPLTATQIINVEQYLKETGYDGRTFNSLDQYYLYFVNKMNETEHESLKEVPLTELNWIFSMEGSYQTNNVLCSSDEAYQALVKDLQEMNSPLAAEILGKNWLGQYDVALKETGDIREVALNYFYQQCFQFGYGDGEKDRLGIDDYKDAATMAEAEKLIAQLLANLAAKGDPEGNNSVTIDAYFGLDGQKTGNFPEDMRKSVWAKAMLNRTDADPDPVDPDPVDPGPVDPDPVDPDPVDPDPVDPNPRPDPDPDPRPDPEPDDPEIPDPDVPLAEEPVVPPVEEIEDPEVPLEEEPEEVEIPDEEVPLADVPKTGDISAMWYAATLLSACGLAVLHILKKREEA